VGFDPRHGGNNTSDDLSARHAFCLNERILCFTPRFEESPFLWSINQSLFSVVKDYFEMMRISSSEIKAKNAM
jgi:hypothetical protein